MAKIKKIAVLGVDPGQKGAFVLLQEDDFQNWPMPLKGKDVDFQAVLSLLLKIKAQHKCHVFLERAMSMGMGSTGAFNYGRGFAALEIAIKQSVLPVTLVEPTKWCRVMHDGISSDLKPKAKSVIAVERLFPTIVFRIPKGPKSGKLDEGVVDALLIAGYGMRTLGVSSPLSKADAFTGYSCNCNKSLCSCGGNRAPGWVRKDTPKARGCFLDDF